MNVDAPVSVEPVEPSPETLPQSQNATLADVVSATDAPSGSPMLNRDGTPRKKPGRKPGTKNQLPSAEPLGETIAQAATLSPTAPKTPQEKKAIRLGCDQTSRAILGTVVGGMRELVGPEWDFESQEEADGMRIALAAYIEAKGGGEMSVEMALLLQTSGYALPRFRHQNTREKFSAFFKSSWQAIRDVFRR